MNPETLSSVIRASLPALDETDTVEGRTRLWLMAQGRYISAGYYFKNKGIVHLTLIDGDMGANDSLNMQETIHGSLPSAMGCGWFFVQPSLNGKPEIREYCHYYISL